MKKEIIEEMTLAKAFMELDNKGISHEAKMSLIDIMAKLSQDSFRNGIRTASYV